MMTFNAFNSLYWEYHAAIYANALKLIKDPVIAEDIVQEVFVTVWGSDILLTLTKILPVGYSSLAT
jgi:DNA-directed RNA polymerase specialized sigma24 family protein